MTRVSPSGVRQSILAMLSGVCQPLLKKRGDEVINIVARASVNDPVIRGLFDDSDIHLNRPLCELCDAGKIAS
jgi:hypothetical protein